MEGKVEFYKETEFKDTEIGRIPKEWEVVKLKHLVKRDKFAIVDGPFGTQLHSNEYVEWGVPLIRVDNINKNGSFNPNNLVYITEEKWEELKRSAIFPRDILLAKTGATIGKVCLFPEKFKKGLIASSCAKITIDPSKAYNQYIFYFLLSNFGYSQILALATGSTRPTINLNPISKVKIAIPKNIKEQQKIAEILSTVDEAIQKTDEIIDKTESLKKGLMQELLTKGIGHKEFKDTEVGRIPKDWKVVKLEEITTKIKDIDHKMPKKQEIGIPFVSIKCMLKYPDFNFYLDPNDPDLEFISKEEYEYHVQRFDVERGDIIYSRFGSIGNAKLITTEQPFIASYSIVLIKPNRNKVNSTFLTYILNSETVRKQAKIATKGATNRNLHLKDIKNLRVPLPSLFEQQKIAEILSTVGEKLEILKQEKVKLERIKRWFMEELLTGRIRVRIA